MVVVVVKMVTLMVKMVMMMVVSWGCRWWRRWNRSHLRKSCCSKVGGRPYLQSSSSIIFKLLCLKPTGGRGHICRGRPQCRRGRRLQKWLHSSPLHRPLSGTCGESISEKFTILSCAHEEKYLGCASHMLHLQVSHLTIFILVISCIMHHHQQFFPPSSIFRLTGKASARPSLPWCRGWPWTFSW